MDFAERLEAAKRASTSHLLLRCARLLNERAVATLPSPEGMQPRPAHLSLFPHIELEGGTRVTDLAAKVGITKQAVGQLVDDLESFGFVERTRDPDDGRAKRVCFTEQGRQAMLHGLAHLQRMDEELKDVLGPRRMKAMRDALLVLHDELDAAPEPEAR